ncbi:type VII secretion protein EsaA [Lactovum odontotermitis]
MIKKEVRQSQVLWAVFDRKMRKFRLIATGVIVFLLICAGCVYFALTQLLQKKPQTAKPTIALVNEDQPAAFNDKSYNFGQSFINAVSNDNKYNWQVVTRSVASKAYKDDSVQAVIYLPQNFSSNLLTLEALDPQKAQVDYKVQNTDSALTDKRLQDKIVDVLYNFNTSIVKMYYASVAGNVADAQNNMSSVVDSQGNILNKLNTQVYGPFQTTDQGYSSVVTISDSLKTQNDSWIDAQNTFTGNVTKMLGAYSDDLNKQLPNLTSYFDTQKKIIDTNLTNANKTLTSQAESDQKFYYKQYTEAYNKATQALQQFDTTDESGSEAGLFAQLKAQIDAYNTRITDTSSDIGTQIDSLTEKQTTLLGLEKDLYSEFFASDTSPTPEDTDFTSLQTTANARTALAKEISSSFKTTDNLDKGYQSRLSTLLSQVSVESSQYAPLLDALVSNGSLSSSEQAAINEKLSVLKNYASAYGLNTGSVDFKDVPDKSSEAPTYTKQLTVTVPAGESYVLTLQADNGSAALISAADETGSPLAVTSPDVLILENPAAAPEMTTDPETGEEIEVPAETGPSKTFTITYEVTATEAESAAGLTSVTASTSDSAGNNVQSSTDSFGLIPAQPISDYAGGSSFGTIRALLDNIDTASALIAFLYGAPGVTYSDMTGITDFEGSADAKSVYKMYGNMDQNQTAERLSDEDVDQFMKAGASNITSVTETLEALSKVLSGLQKDKSTLDEALPGDYFSQIISDLDQWYRQTAETLDNEYKNWKENETKVMEEKPWQADSQEEDVLYYDKTSGETLYQTLKGMMTSSAAQAKGTAASAQIIKSNAGQFEQMVKTVTQTQTAAKSVIANTGSLLTTGANDFKNTQDYYANFETILANTRDTNANTGNIFDFLAKPLAAKDTTPKAKESTQAFDWRWIIVLVGGILLGVLAKTWIRAKPKQEE